MRDDEYGIIRNSAFIIMWYYAIILILIDDVGYKQVFLKQIKKPEYIILGLMRLSKYTFQEEQNYENKRQRGFNSVVGIHVLLFGCNLSVASWILFLALAQTR